jgi:hypothetical protein
MRTKQAQSGTKREKLPALPALPLLLTGGVRPCKCSLIRLKKPTLPTFHPDSTLIYNEEKTSRTLIRKS